MLYFDKNTPWVMGFLHKSCTSSFSRVLGTKDVNSSSLLECACRPKFVQREGSCRICMQVRPATSPRRCRQPGETAGEPVICDLWMSCQAVKWSRKELYDVSSSVCIAQARRRSMREGGCTCAARICSRRNDQPALGRWPVRGVLLGDLFRTGPGGPGLENRAR
jgi:hypothetical protein